MTCTCELIIGRADQNESGILFNHRLTLYEHFRPILVFERKPSLTDGGALIDRWIPHLDSIIEDCMVMMAGYGVGDEAVMRLISGSRTETGDGIWDLNGLDEQRMEELYAAARQAFQLKVRKTKHSTSSERWKVLACIFKDSSIGNTICKLHDYDIDIEICKSVYQSEYSPWNEDVRVWGEL